MLGCLAGAGAGASLWASVGICLKEVYGSSLVVVHVGLWLFLKTLLVLIWLFSCRSLFIVTLVSVGEIDWKHFTASELVANTAQELMWSVHGCGLLCVGGCSAGAVPWLKKLCWLSVVLLSVCQMTRWQRYGLVQFSCLSLRKLFLFGKLGWGGLGEIALHLQRPEACYLRKCRIFLREQLFREKAVKPETCSEGLPDLGAVSCDHLLRDVVHFRSPSAGRQQRRARACVHVLLLVLSVQGIERCAWECF